MRAGVLPYRAELWTDAEWHEGYDSGRLDYFGQLDELPRYSILIGYLAYFGADVELLDVGCGQGLLRARIDALPFRRYVGIDVTDRAIARARRLEDDRTQFVLGDVMVTAVPGPFDVVVLNEVLSVVPDAGALIDRVTTLARPGAKVLTCNWRHRGDAHLWRELDARLERVDRVDVQNNANPIATRGWRMSCHRVPPDLS